MLISVLCVWLWVVCTRAGILSKWANLCAISLWVIGNLIDDKVLIGFAKFAWMAVLIAGLYLGIKI